MPLKLFIFLIVFLVIILQVSAIPNFFSSDAAPDLIIILLVFFTAEAGFARVWKWAIFVGFISDIIFFTLLGTSALSFLIIAYGTEIVAKRFLAGQKAWKMFVLASVAAICLAFDYSFTFLLAKIINYFYSTPYSEYFSWTVLARSALYNFIAASIIYWPFKKIKNLIVLRQELKIE